MSFVEWLIYGAPWWLQAIGGAIFIVLVLIPLVRIVGLKNTLEIGAIVGAVFGALVYGRRERQQGWKDAQSKGERDAQSAIDQASRARADADLSNADPGRLRDDDGYRRD